MGNIDDDGRHRVDPDSVFYRLATSVTRASRSSAARRIAGSGERRPQDGGLGSVRGPGPAGVPLDDQPVPRGQGVNADRPAGHCRAVVAAAAGIAPTVDAAIRRLGRPPRVARAMAARPGHHLGTGDQVAAATTPSRAADPIDERSAPRPAPPGARARDDLAGTRSARLLCRGVRCARRGVRARRLPRLGPVPEPDSPAPAPLIRPLRMLPPAGPPGAGDKTGRG